MSSTIELTEEDCMSIDRLTHECQKCLCSTCKKSCWGFIECQEDFIGRIQKKCDKYERRYK